MTHTLQAIAWTLIHFCWQAAVIAGLYGLTIRLMTRRNSGATGQTTAAVTSQTRYLVALGALLCMLAAGLVTFAWQMLPEAPVAGMAGAIGERTGDFPRMADPGIAPSAALVPSAIASVEPAPRFML